MEIDERELPPSAVAREHSRQNLEDRDPEEYPHAGVVGSHRVRRLLDALTDYYDPEVAARTVEGTDPEQLPPRIEDTRLYEMLIGREATETLTRSIHNGDEQTQSYFAGAPDQTRDVSGLGAITELEEHVGRSAPIIYIFGEPGSGKTNFGLLLSQLWMREHPEGEIGSNIRTWQECDRWIPRYPELDEWLGENLEEMDSGGTTQAEDANHRLFVFDEASSHASGRGKQGYEAGKLLGPLIYKIRKTRAGLIIIGHDGRDVHPAVRTLATVVERNRGEVKKATLWEDVKDREGRGKIMDLSGIPETDYRYDDGEATSWSWDTEEEDEGVDIERVESMAEDMAEREVKKLGARLAAEDWIELTQEEIGRALGEAYRGEPFHQNTVSGWKRQYA